MKRAIFVKCILCNTHYYTDCQIRLVCLCILGMHLSAEGRQSFLLYVFSVGSYINAVKACVNIWSDGMASIMHWMLLLLYFISFGTSLWLLVLLLNAYRFVLHRGRIFSGAYWRLGETGRSRSQLLKMWKLPRNQLLILMIWQLRVLQR